MARQQKTKVAPPKDNSQSHGRRQPFHLEFLNQAQKMAWGAFDQHDVLFLLGPAGCGKSHLACAFAISEILAKRKKKIVLTRPIVEAGESLGFLPGSFEEKVNPYILPLYDCISKCVGEEGPQREAVNRSIEVAPIAYMRGRSLRNSEKLITPTGLKAIGEIQVGDYVIGSNGRPTKVTGVYPQGKLPIFEMGFSDKTSSFCSADHLWNTMSLNEKRHNKGFTTKTTKEIMETVKNKHKQKVHRVPIVSAPVEFASQEVSVDPYILGVLLGDGHIRKGSVRISTKDIEILEECRNRLPSGLEIKFRKGYDYAIVSKAKNEILSNLYQYDLVGSKSNNKFVPDEYKFNSTSVRLQVLQGLLDTDGWICKHRSGNVRIQFCSSSRRLAEDVEFLVRSLGGMASKRLREFDANDEHEYNGKIIRHVHSVFVVDIMMPINPFKLSRKANQYSNNQKFTKLISFVKNAGEDDCTCIKVDADDSLYLTNDFVVTHNTFNDAVCIFDEAQNATVSQLKLFMTRFGENSKIIITGDPNQSDLRSNEQGLMHVVNRLQDLVGVGMIHFKTGSIVRHPLIGSILEKLEEQEGKV